MHGKCSIQLDREERDCILRGKRAEATEFGNNAASWTRATGVWVRIHHGTRRFAASTIAAYQSLLSGSQRDYSSYQPATRTDRTDDMRRAGHSSQTQPYCAKKVFFANIAHAYSPRHCELGKGVPTNHISPLRMRDRDHPTRAMRDPNVLRTAETLGRQCCPPRNSSIASP